MPRGYSRGSGRHEQLVNNNKPSPQLGKGRHKTYISQAVDGLWECDEENDANRYVRESNQGEGDEQIPRLETKEMLGIIHNSIKTSLCF